MKRFTRKAFLLMTLVIMAGYLIKVYLNNQPIKVGVMHSLTGTMALSESGVVDAVLLAIEELNQTGGVLGRQIEAVVRDGQSDPQVFANIAQTLIYQDKVDVVFGCWTSSCRKSVTPVFEQAKHLLYYPLQYEGLEQSDHIIYLGALPNQQVFPALEWIFGHLGKKVYLVGSDYVYPRVVNHIIQDKVLSWRGQILGEAYVSLGGTDFTAIIDDIKRLQPDVIINTINGKSNLSFFRQLRSHGISANQIPTLSFSIAENELSAYNGIDMSGDYHAWNYIQADENPLNKKFIASFKARYGNERRIGNPMMTAYMGVYLWAKAVALAQSSEVNQVRQFTGDMSIKGPSGMLYVDSSSNHVWKSMHIAKVTEKNFLQSVWHSKGPIGPTPYPKLTAETDWSEYLAVLQTNWQGLWQ